MKDISIFLEKEVIPSEVELVEKLGSAYKLWQEIYNFVLDKYPNGISEWNFPGKKYGWSFHIKDKKRAIIYLLPRENYFKAAFVFGDKATYEIMESDISDKIKSELQSARKYAEGSGIRIKVKDESVIPDIKKLVEIKLKN